MLPNQSKFLELDESQFVPAETYIPEYSPISNDEITQELNSYANEPLPVYNNRNFPGRSMPTDMAGAKKFAPAGFVGLMSKPKDVSLNTLFELARDLNDVYKRPMKAVWGAADAVMEAAEKPFRTNAHGVASAITALAMPGGLTIKSAQGFIEGLKGWRGAAEVMHRLGVKNAKEKLSPEAFAKKQKEYEEKLKKKGIIGKIATSVIHDAMDNPLDFWSEFAEDPLLVGSLAEGAVKSVAKSGSRAIVKGLGENAVLESITWGSRTRSFLKSKLGEKDYQEFISIVDKAREKGGGGAVGFMESLKGASESLQSKVKDLAKKNMSILDKKPLEKITKVKIGPAKVANDQIEKFIRDVLPEEVVKGGNESALKLLQEGKASEAIAEAVLTKQSKIAKSLIENPTERALLELNSSGINAKIGQLSNDSQVHLWEALKKYNRLEENAFNDYTIKDVLKRLPQEVGRIHRPQMEMAAMKADPKIAEILGKPFTDVTPTDIEYVFQQYSKIIPQEKLIPIMQKAGVAIKGANIAPIYNPRSLGALNFFDENLRGAGLYDDFAHPMFITNQALDADKEVFLEKFREGLETATGKKFMDKSMAKKLEQMGRAVEDRAEFIKLSPQEQHFVGKNGPFRKIMDELHRKLDMAIEMENGVRASKGLPPLEKLGYRKNYLPHLFQTMEKTGLWEAGGIYDDLAPSITMAATRAREGTLTNYPTNIMEVYQTYLNGVMRFVHKRPVAQALTEKLQGYPMSPAFKEYIGQHLKSFAGKRVEDPVIDTMVKGFMMSPLAPLLGVTESTARETVYTAAYNLLQWGYASGMGLNFKLPVRNMFQSLLGMPNTNMKTWTHAIQDVGKLMGPASAHDVETRALGKILQNSEVYKGRVGNLSQMLPTEVSRNAAFPGRFETLLRKSIEVTGFPATEKWLFSQTMANGLRYRMEQLGIKSYDALLKHSKYADVLKYSENLATKVHFHYNKMFRPLFLNNPSGAHILQYFTFGGRMANQALRDIMLPSRHKTLMKMLFQQSLLATTLTAGGLAGSGYAAYFSAVDPLKQLLQVGGPDTPKSIKSPALKGVYGALQASVGGLTGSKRLQSRGFTQMKQSVTPAAYKIGKEAMAFKDPSRLFLYKKYPKYKKKRP